MISPAPVWAPGADAEDDGPARARERALELARHWMVIIPGLWYHGGVVGLEVGDRILPAVLTGQETLSPHTNPSWTYVTLNRQFAYFLTRLRTARAATTPQTLLDSTAALYRVQPIGGLEPDPQAAPGVPDFMCPLAVVLEVIPIPAFAETSLALLPTLLESPTMLEEVEAGARIDLYIDVQKLATAARAMKQAEGDFRLEEYVPRDRLEALFDLSIRTARDINESLIAFKAQRQQAIQVRGRH